MEVKRVVFNSIPQSVEVTAKVCTDAPVKLEDEFAVRLWKRGHYTPFEHNTMELPVSDPCAAVLTKWVMETEVLGLYNPAFRVSPRGTILGSLRAFAEALGIDYLQCLERLTMSEGRITYYVETNIGVAREILRHRCLSFTERSTRYTKSHSPMYSSPEMNTCFPHTTVAKFREAGVKNDYTREI